MIYWGHVVGTFLMRFVPVQLAYRLVAWLTPLALALFARGHRRRATDNMRQVLGPQADPREARRLTTRDYRLFDIQHAVLPTRLSLPDFYQELVSTQQILNRKHLGWRAVRSLSGILAGNLARGQTNTLKMLWKFNSIYDSRLQIADHQQPVHYELSTPPEAKVVVDAKSIYIHPANGHRSLVLDEATQSFVDQTRMKAEPIL